MDIFSCFPSFTTKCHQSMAFYCTKHDPKMDYFSSEASLSRPPPPQTLTFLGGKNHNQDLNKIAQQEIEIVSVGRRVGELLRKGDVWVMRCWLSDGRVSHAFVS